MGVNVSRKALETAVWRPLGDAQILFMTAEFIPELLGEGERGGGKTITLVMCFCQYVGRGFGMSWRGVIFRKSYKALSDIIKQSKQWIPQFYPAAVFTANNNTWTFPDGEQLIFSQFKTPDDYWDWHGQELPFIGWEELTSWHNDECYTAMMTCNRSSAPGVPKIIRSTTNPYGPGRIWVKERWQLPDMRRKIVKTTDDHGYENPLRMAVHFKYQDNTALNINDPAYLSKIRAGAGSNEAMRKAWLEGDWDVDVGGMFDDLFARNIHVVKPFLLPALNGRGHGWKLDRAFDWGYSKPYSIGIYATSDGTPYRDSQGNLVPSVNGDVYRVAELYGWNGKPNQGCKQDANEIAEALRNMEIQYGIHGLVKPGPADINIFARDRGPAMVHEFNKRKVGFTQATKDPGSRVRGWQLIRTRLQNSVPPYKSTGETGTDGKPVPILDDDGHKIYMPREEPGLFFFEGRNTHLMRTMLGAPRDEDNPDDIDSDYEDHSIDELRYRIATKARVMGPPQKY